MFAVFWQNMKMNIEMNSETEMNKEETIVTIEDTKVDDREQMPAVALRGLTILPGMVIHFDLSRDKSIEAVERAMLGDQRLLVVTQKDPDEEEPGFDSLYDVGTVTLIKQVSKLPDHIVRVLVEGISRARLYGFVEETDCLVTSMSYLADDMSDIEEETREAMTRTVKETFLAYHACYPKIGKAVADQLEENAPLGELLDSIVINMPLDFHKKQQILSAVSVKERYEILTGILAREVDIVKIKNELAAQIKQRVDKNQKDYILREQMQYIKEELGDNNTESDIEQFENAVEKLKAKKEVKEKIRKEISRYKNVAGSSSEGAVERAYIETLLELPWDKASKDSHDLERAEEILNEEHYGLEKVKERILEYLAVRTLTGKGQSPIICLVGPPGTGKTSIAKSVAEALHKKYIRICLGGVRDEAEIRGHRKTYVGAMPGRIINAIRQAGVKNPLLLLDEIDKVSNDYKGDPSAALLEVLDGEQNSAFRDHYVEIPVDLSEVLFLATANSTETIPRPLLDRMELIEINSYTANEKFHIAREHLAAKQLAKNGIKPEELEFTDEALKEIISRYTREAGVRGLERQIGAVCRKEARQILQNRQQAKAEKETDSDSTGSKKAVITPDNLEHYLGKPKFTQESVNKTDEVGIVRGLAWTSVGGDTLQIEVNVMPGEGEIDMTGQMGDVMKESARIAMSYVRSVSEEYQVPVEMFQKKDFHLHIPEGAVPKDGPSAGITMATAILSAVTQIPVRADLAMTGEITLRGKVLPIGGLKEKMLAARMAGVKTVLVPQENEKDVEEIPQEIKEGLEICLVSDMKQVIDHAFAKPGKKDVKKSKNK